MYPRAELTRLAAKKELLQARIAVQRLECAECAYRLARPIQFLDRVTAKFPHMSPWMKFLGVPVGVMVGRKLTTSGHGGKIASILKYAPLATQAMRLVSVLRAKAKAR